MTLQTLSEYLCCFIERHRVDFVLSPPLTTTTADMCSGMAEMSTLSSPNMATCHMLVEVRVACLPTALLRHPPTLAWRGPWRGRSHAPPHVAWRCTP
jgi:hypothetical protein